MKRATTENTSGRRVSIRRSPGTAASRSGRMPSSALSPSLPRKKSVTTRPILENRMLPGEPEEMRQEEKAKRCAPTMPTWGVKGQKRPETGKYRGVCESPETRITAIFQGFSSGVPGGIRTRDLLVRSQTLYPAELQAHVLALSNVLSYYNPARASCQAPGRNLLC